MSCYTCGQSSAAQQMVRKIPMISNSGSTSGAPKRWQYSYPRARDDRNWTLFTCGRYTCISIVEITLLFSSSSLLQITLPSDQVLVGRLLFSSSLLLSQAGSHPYSAIA